jgi:hypothetical protein
MKLGRNYSAAENYRNITLIAFLYKPCNLTPKLYGWRLNISMRYTWIHAINEPRNFSNKTSRAEKINVIPCVVN